MSNSIKQDKRRRLLFSKFETTTLQNKALLRDTSLLDLLKQQGDISTFPRNSSKTRVRNRCVLTGRSRGNFRFCKLSRIRLRKMVSFGLLNGLKKASW